MKWYLRPTIVIIAILTLGPFAIPLIWRSPALNRWNKIFLTIVTIAMTIATIMITATAITAIAGYYKRLLEELQGLQNLK